MARPKRKRKPAPPPERRPSATIALDVNLTEVDPEAWCDDCEAPTASSVVALVTAADDPGIVLMRRAQTLCPDCGWSARD